jgi:spermidine/putrescine transport system ATP-binding protein
MLQLENIHKTYDHPILRGISFNVAAGETVSLLGPSGSGKSTLLRIIAGLEPPDTGRVLWNDVDLAATPAHRRDFGLVFQDYALFPHLNVFENAAFGLRMRAWPGESVQARVREVLELVEMTGFERRQVNDLSGGEQQRVALARALASRPRLLMFDEPLGALDRTLRAGLLVELRRILRTAGVPAVYVTHDQEEAFAIADRVLILHDGRIIRSGPPAEIAAAPGSAWVAEFLGLGSILEGKAVSKKGRLWRVKTRIGTLTSDCGPTTRPGQIVRVLIRPERVKRGGGASAVRSRVRDVVFQKEGYRVTLQNGLVVHLRRAPRINESIGLLLGTVECLG